MTDKFIIGANRRTYSAKGEAVPLVWTPEEVAQIEVALDRFEAAMDAYLARRPVFIPPAGRTWADLRGGRADPGQSGRDWSALLQERARVAAAPRDAEIDTPFDNLARAATDLVYAIDEADYLGVEDLDFAAKRHTFVRLGRLLTEALEAYRAVKAYRAVRT